MPSYSNKQLFLSIQNGEEEIMFYLTKKYYQTSRRWLRREGCIDSDTPIIFSTVLVNICREIQHQRISPEIEFEHVFFNALRNYLTQLKNSEEDIETQIENTEVIASCFSIMEEYSKKILISRYVEKRSFETIAELQNFSNPVIAQFEVNKAFNQFEAISKVRLNIPTENS
jgi:hypothetical protein